MLSFDESRLARELSQRALSWPAGLLRTTFGNRIHLRLGFSPPTKCAMLGCMALEPASDIGDYVKAVERIRSQLADLQREHEQSLPLWVVFGPGTSDHPGMFLIRLWLTLPKPVMTNCLIRANSLKEIRELLPDGLTRLPRAENDDPNIIETWI